MKRTITEYPGGYPVIAVNENDEQSLLIKALSVPNTPSSLSPRPMADPEGVENAFTQVGLLVSAWVKLLN